MANSINPGVGGAYRYNPDTDTVELIDFTFDPFAGPHPGAEEAQAPIPEPEIPPPPPDADPDTFEP